MKKVGFTGTQEGMSYRQQEVVEVCLLKCKELHHGDCIGADFDADEIAHKLGLRVIVHPPINECKRSFCKFDEIHEAKDYLVRNRDIVDSSDFLLATPKEEIGEELRSGTWATVRYARKKNKLIYIVRPSGKIETENGGVV